MKVAVLGTGMVGRVLAARLDELGHQVVLGTRDVAATKARAEPDAIGSDSWLAANASIALVGFHEAGAFGELFVNATNGGGSLAALEAVGADGLQGKIILDVANPLDFSRGFPPSLHVKDTDSLGEQIQRAFPQARVVKTLNTMTAALMVAPEQVADGTSTVFMSGDDAAAKAAVRLLLESFGWRDILDLGGISTARGTEMYLPLWLRIMGALGTPMFNISVSRVGQAGSGMLEPGSQPGEVR